MVSDPLSKPIVDLGQFPAGLCWVTLALPQARQAHCRPQHFFTNLDALVEFLQHLCHDNFETGMDQESID